MVSGWRYRILSVLGTFFITLFSVIIANHPTTQHFAAQYIPLVNRLNPVILSNGDLFIAYLTSIVIILGAVSPLFKPRPRRILDALMSSQKRILVGILALATIGYFDYSYRLPRITLVLTGFTLIVFVPLWFVWIRRRPASDENAIIVGDDPPAMTDIYTSVEGSVLGYVSPPFGRGREITDGGQVSLEDRSDVFISGHLRRIGGLARLDEVLVKYDIGTAYLAFSSSDRAEFFGALDSCHQHGVRAKVHREHVDDVLIEGVGEGDIVDVDVDPLDLQDYLFKRIFDVGFSVIGLVILSPVILSIIAAIKLDDGGPIFYKQERTAEFGKPFTVIKFRTMTPSGENPEPLNDAENDRITRIGRILRQTHLDEVPQLLSILTGKMSVVGPRAVWREEEILLEEETDVWRRRWFVKPGLTGLAQIRDITSETPEKKLRSDLEYIRRQSFWFDLKIVLRQIWIVVADALVAIRRNGII